MNTKDMESQLNVQNTHENGDLSSSRCSSSISHAETLHEISNRSSSNQPLFQPGISNQNGHSNRTSIECGEKRLQDGVGTYVGKNQYRYKVEYLTEKSQAKIKSKRMLKRQNVIQQKRQIIFDQTHNGDTILESAQPPVDITSSDNEQISSRISFDQALYNKSHIFIMCGKIKHSNTQAQFEGINELKNYLTEKSQNKKIMSTDVFEIIETGITRILLSVMKNSTDIELKRKISQIFINLALGDKREVQKLINSDLIESLGEQIQGTIDTTHIINCVWALSNIALTHIDMRDNIIRHLPSIFKLLEKCMQIPQETNLGMSYDRLQSEIVFFISSMTRQENIVATHYMFHYSIGIEILARCLKSFSFFNPEHYVQIDGDQKILNEKVSQYLLDIINTFCTVNDTMLLNATQLTQMMAGRQLDKVINSQDLFSQLLRILQYSGDQLLQEKTWQLVGSICCCNFNENNVRSFFKDSNCENMIKLIHHSLNSQKLSPKIMKNCIFTLSNIIADKHVFLEQILQNNLIQVLTKLWSYILNQQNIMNSQNNLKSKKNNETYEDILGIKNEIIYCIGNCVLGIQDTPFIEGLQLLKMAIDQGAMQILTEALDYNQFKTHTTGIKVALDGLNRYLKCFKKANKSKQPEIVASFHNYFDDLTLMFETQYNGLDVIENCQLHPDHHVYIMAQKIIVKYFELDNSSSVEIHQLIDKAQKKS